MRIALLIFKMILATKNQPGYLHENPTLLDLIDHRTHITSPLTKRVFFSDQTVVLPEPFSHPTLREDEKVFFLLTGAAVCSTAVHSQKNGKNKAWQKTVIWVAVMHSLYIGKNNI